MGPKRVAAKQGKKRRRDVDEDVGEGGDDFFLFDDENPRKKADDDEEEDEEVAETVEEKRLRLAKEYLSQLEVEREADDSGDEDTLGAKLKQEALEASGRLHRHIADLVDLPPVPSCTSNLMQWYSASGGRFSRCHPSSVTAVALTADDSIAFTVSKDGSIYKWDIETMTKTRLYRNADGKGERTAAQEGGATWVRSGPRQGSTRALYTAAVSSDGQYLAVGGGDRKVHVFDVKSGLQVQEYPGHRDVISGLAFREGTHQLFSCSFDRTVKLWSLDDQAYMDSLFGHQAEVLAIDILRKERAVTSANDHSCRVWKVPEESQLVFRSPSMSVDCCRYITGTEWVSGTNDGTLQVWSQMKKKPVGLVKGAHGGAGATPPAANGLQGTGFKDQSPADAVLGWIQSVAVCRSSDLVASGAGDSLIKLWRAHQGKYGLTLAEVGALPVKGFVNGLQLSRSGRFLLAALGQEPRLGRWGRQGQARNGLLMFPLGVKSS